MQTKAIHLKNLFIGFTVLLAVNLKAQCNANFSIITSSNIPATAMVAQSYNSASDGLYIWNWGDGSANDTTYNTNWNYPTTTHDYTATGTYTICLNYQSVSAGCNSSFCWAFPVSSTTLPPKFISFQSASDSTWYGFCPQMPVTASFYIQALVDGYTPSDSLNAKILFGDGKDTLFKLSPYYPQGGGQGNVSASFNHTYTTGGLYSVQYILYDNAGITGDTITNYNELDLQDSCGNLNGYMYVDMNGNCQFDNGDSVLSNVWFNIHSSTNNNYWGWTDSLGYYSVNVPAANTYTLSVPYLNSYGFAYTCSGVGLSGITVPSTVNIGLVCPSGFDLTGDFWGWHFTPGGGVASIQAYPENLSCLPQGGTAVLTLDPNTTFINEVWGRPVTVSGNQVSWNFANTNALNNWWWGYNQTNWRYMGLNCSSNLQIGDSVCFTLNVSPTAGDINPANNTITKCYPVKTSWDPNFKEVYPRGVGAQGYVAQNTEFTYTIHFQNTGTAPAHNIAVIDTIDADLDMNTFQIISSSHYVSPHVIGGNLIKFEFNNIMLPDSATNPAASQGWVTYKIKAKPGQPGGTQYTNTAYIYFDFNPAVITNTTINTVNLSAVNVSQTLASVYGISVAPNPAGDFTQLTLNSKESGKITIQLMDMVGQIVQSKENVMNKGKNIFSLETSTLPEGVYLVNIISEKNIIGLVKIVK